MQTPKLPRFDAPFLKQLLGSAAHPGSPAAAADYDLTCVFMLIFHKGGEPHILAVLKADTPGYPWRNQVALPGGHVDPEDIDSLAAAYRELQEEIGIDRKHVEYIGSMGHFQTIRNKDIQVFVGLWKEDRAELRCEAKEIAEIIEIPIESLLKTHLQGNFNGCLPDIPDLLYPYGRVTVWGATARIFHYFMELILANLDPNIIEGLNA